MIGPVRIPSRTATPLAALVVLCCLMRSGPARADDVDLCISSSDQGQVLRDRGQLLDARQRFVECAKEHCPGPIRGDCASWLVDVDARIPSLVLRARDEQGRDLADVRVLIDGRPLAERIDGRAIAIDPGEHLLRFERAGAEPLQLAIVAREGEKQRALDVAWKATPQPDKPHSTSQPRERPSVPLGAWILGGVGVLGLGGFTYFGWTAKSEVDDMRDSCAPNCDPGRVDDARRSATIANLSLGVGALAFGAAAWLILSNGAGDEPSSAVQPTLSVGLLPMPSGLSAGVSTRF